MSTDGEKLWQGNQLILHARNHPEGSCYRVFGYGGTLDNLLQADPLTLEFDTGDHKVLAMEGDEVLCHDLSVTIVVKRFGKLRFTAKLEALDGKPVRDHPVQMFQLLQGGLAATHASQLHILRAKA
jgi:hypothetical protein